MQARYLTNLVRRYAPHSSADIDPLAEAISRKRALRQTRLIDLAAVATSLAYVDRDELDALALQAIRDTNPNFSPQLIDSYTDDQWMGIVNSAKGKYFEYLVVDRLNQHERVGDLYLAEGQHAVVAGSMSQPGWDVQITDETGQIVHLVQLKASENAGYIQNALETYPEIQILATDEVASQLGEHNIVLDSNIGVADLEHQIGLTLDGMDRGFMDEFWSAFNPLLPMLVIAASESYKISVGKSTVRSSALLAKDRAARGLAAGAAGALVKAVSDSFLVALPASLLVGWLFDRNANTESMRQATRQHARRMQVRTGYLLALDKPGGR